jgi:3-hydroxyacyl-CoA dehydrogenase/enoyl-CoA hydratase/3-hydroxybutyryl-CoA epimerase
VFEDLALKHRVLEEVEPALDSTAIYASNTSTIPIASIAGAAKHPERVLGMHFFSPVHRMPLLEVIVTPETAPDATVSAVAYGKSLGKTVIVVNDGPGFYTTRTLSAYMNEAGRLLDEGASIDSIDEALVDFGFPVGPITLLDEVGIDVGGKVGLVLSEAFGPRMAASEAMRRVVAAGRTGRKGGKGLLCVRCRREERQRGPDGLRSDRRPAARGSEVRDCRSLRAGNGQRGRTLSPRGNSSLGARR